MTTYIFGGENVTGVAVLNGMRAGLVDLANRFYRQALDCQTFDEQEELTSGFLRMFMDGMAECLACEEEMMAESFYPDREEHQQEHDDFIDKLYAMRRRHKLGESAMAVEIFHEVREWFLSHWEYADGRLLLFLDRTEMFRAVGAASVAPGPAGKTAMYAPVEPSHVN
ncbi:MAG: hemerythrin family protein [Sporomusaceae bacterium]|nr:hemerythrin family protein [Sporomusaceae bacterium]